MKADEIATVQCSQITGVIYGSQIGRLFVSGAHPTTKIPAPTRAVMAVWGNYNDMRKRGGLRWFLFAGILRLTALLVRERIGEDNGK